MEKRLPLRAGTVLQGRYEITKLLGAGGMGAVYEAYNERTSGYVALKETFATDEYGISAFEREAKLLANLDHEALPRVMDYFAENEGYFLVMDLIKGDDLEKLLKERKKPFEIEKVLSWADQILDALEDLHINGIIHRDIKPANIKLTPRGKIKLIDFGIAKGTAGELTKVSTINAATNGYAPLEQVLRANDDAFQLLSVGYFEKTYEILQQGTDERADIYALGSTLYQLLTNRTPVNAPTRALSVWSGQKDRLVLPHEINPQISKEVSEAIQRALRLDRDERYRTAAEMRQALKKTVEPAAKIKSEPIVPVEPVPTVLSPPVKVSGEQETQPNPRLFQPQSPTPSQRIIEPEQTSAPQKTNRKLFYAGIIGLISFLAVGVLGYLTYSNAGTNSNISVLSSNKNSTPNIPANAKYKLVHTLTGHTGWVLSVAFSPDGKTIVSGGGDHTIKLWDATNGSFKQNLSENRVNVVSIAFSPDGKTIVCPGSRGGTIDLWDATNGSLKQTLAGHGGMVTSLAFSPDGQTIVSGSRDNTVKLWDAVSGNLKQTLDGKSGWVLSVAFSPDGKTIVSGSYDKTIILWDAISGSLKQTLTGHGGMVASVAFSPDGKTIVSAGTDTTIKLWDATNGSFKQNLAENMNWVNSVMFSPDGKTIVSVGADKAIILRDATNGSLKQALAGHSGEVTSVAFSRDGQMIASGGDDRTIKLWRVE